MDINKIKFDDFVSKVNDISKDPQQKIVLSGFVGKSPNKGCIRVYYDASLSDYSEVNSDDVIHQEPLQNSSLGGSAIWVKTDAKISSGNDNYHYDANNNYFKGDIANAYTRTATMPTIAITIRPTTGIRTLCDLQPTINLLPTTGIKTICDSGACGPGITPTTGVKTICDMAACGPGGLPTTGVRTVCADCQFPSPYTGVSAYCGTGNYNPYL